MHDGTWLSELFYAGFIAILGCKRSRKRTVEFSHLIYLVITYHVIIILSRNSRPDN